MTDTEINHVAGYALDIAISEAAETPPAQRELFGTRSPGGWWICGSHGWLPRPMSTCAGDVMLSLIDLMDLWQQNVAIEDLGRGRGDERFLVMCGGLRDAIVAHGPTMPLACARAFLMAARRRHPNVGELLAAM